MGGDIIDLCLFELLDVKEIPIQKNGPGRREVIQVGMKTPQNYIKWTIYKVYFIINPTNCKPHFTNSQVNFVGPGVRGSSGRGPNRGRAPGL